jgi:scyllo-inositol 2-dehydrogenase (NADP+)
LFYEKNGKDFEQLVETIPGNYNIFYDNLFNAIRNGTELFVKPEEAVEVLKILEACLKSNREKRTVLL